MPHDTETPVADQPHVTRIPLRCSSCHTDYDGWMVTNVSLRVAAAYMRTMACPVCRAGAAHQFPRKDRPDMSPGLTQ